MKPLIDITSDRAYKARLSSAIGRKGYLVLSGLSLTFFILFIFISILVGLRFGIILLSPSLLFLMPALWWKYYLSKLPVTGTETNDRLALDVLASLKPASFKPQSDYLWDRLKTNWQALFVLHHLLLSEQITTPLILKGGEAEFNSVLAKAAEFASSDNSKTIEVGHIVGALLYLSPEIEKLLVGSKDSKEDIAKVTSWLSRKLVEDADRQNVKFGGIGRDWAFGFTPLLNRFGINLSQSIQKYGANFGWLTEYKPVLAMESSLASNSNAVALVGEIGVGKTNSVYALAQRLIEGKSAKQLLYHQIIQIKATDILTASAGQSALERIMVSLSSEASRAGHIIIFLDDAELFLSNSLGSFDASKILQSIVAARGFPLIMALTPNSFEKLKGTNPSLTSQMSPVVFNEMAKEDVMRVLEDAAISLESKHNVLISYRAIKAAYDLSGRYEHDVAYPGKAINFLEQSISFAINSVVSEESVEKLIEQSKGIKSSSASVVEAEQLLNLEAKIHERMINQEYAVKAIANALRRARAGVRNFNRPIGSFLFLGPTGVGKTELAKSLAATYFNAETNMIRLDMTEFQGSDDYKRLISDGQADTNSLTLSVRTNPFSVVLLDEIEKAHPNVLNLLLQLLDEGQLTDNSGRKVDFKECIVIATSNAGAQSIRERIFKGEELAKFQPELIEEIISSNTFKPELLNRFDEIVLFRPLEASELAQIVTLMLSETNKTLAAQNIKVELTDKAIALIVKTGYDPRFGARPLRRTLQKTVEDTVAKKILSKEINPGQKLLLDDKDLVI